MMKANQTLLIEPNGKLYGGTFFHKIDEIVNFIDASKFTNIATMVDTHNSILENQSPLSNYTTYKNYVQHVHV